MGKVESAPEKSMFGAQAVSRAEVSVSHVFAPEVPLADVVAMVPQWPWPRSATRSRTTPPEDVGRRLFAFFLEKATGEQESDLAFIRKRMKRDALAIVHATYTQEVISELTGFDYFDEFETPQAVRAYFAVPNLERVYQENGWSDDFEFPRDELVLRTCGDVVILNGWHMTSR